MFTKTNIALLIACMSASSYAYEIKSSLIVENKTDTSIIVDVDIPKEKTRSLLIRPNMTNQLDVSIEGWELYKSYPAPFTIKSNDAHHKLYVQGRINYYVGAWPTVKYSSLDALSTADGLTIDTNYSCFPSNTGFENKIVISGAPGSALHPTTLPTEMHCQGFKSSILQSDHLYYTPTCSDGKRNALFWKIFEKRDDQGYTHFMYTKGYLQELCIDNGFYCDGGTLATLSQSDAAIKNMLDDIVRKGKFCGSW